MPDEVNRAKELREFWRKRNCPGPDSGARERLQRGAVGDHRRHRRHWGRRGPDFALIRLLVAVGLRFLVRYPGCVGNLLIRNEEPAHPGDAKSWT